MFNPWQDLGTVQSELMQAAARQGPGDPHGYMISGSGAGLQVENRNDWAFDKWPARTHASKLTVTPGCW